MNASSDLRMLWSAESRRIWIDTRRYWSETVLGLVLTLVLVLGLLRGVEMVGGMGARGTSAGALVVGFFMWTIAVAAYSGIANDIARETSLGTVEQLVVTPHALVTLFLVRACVHLVLGLATSIVVLVLALAITGETIHVAPNSILALALGVPSLFGIGLVIGAVALLAKRVTALVAAVHLVFIALIGIGAEPLTPLGMLPFAASATVTMRAAVAGDAVTAGQLGFLAAVSAAYLALGALAFRVAERRARRGNVLEHH